jgi:protein-L-isoaspartate O-methyltransferase
MTDLLDVGPDDTVLEIGTGSGYQAAVLSPLVDRVYSIEIVPELGERAAATLEEQGFENVETRVADGYYGWPEAAPFDGIVVTAAAARSPSLVEQLEPGGRMIIPIGTPFSAQMLMLVEKQEDGSITTRQILRCSSCPSPGQAAAERSSMSRPMLLAVAVISAAILAYQSAADAALLDHGLAPLRLHDHLGRAAGLRGQAARRSRSRGTGSCPAFRFAFVACCALFAWLLSAASRARCGCPSTR